MWNASGKEDGRKIAISDSSQPIDIHLVPDRSSWFQADDMVSSAGVKCFLKFLKALLIVSIVSYIVINEVKEGEKDQNHDSNMQSDKILGRTKQDQRSSKTDEILVKDIQGQNLQQSPLTDTIIVRDKKQGQNLQQSLLTDAILVRDKQGQNLQQSRLNDAILVRDDEGQNLQQSHLNDAILVRDDEGQNLQQSRLNDAILVRDDEGQNLQQSSPIDTLLVRVKQGQQSPLTDSFLIRDGQGQIPKKLLLTDSVRIKDKQSQNLQGALQPDESKNAEKDKMTKGVRDKDDSMGCGDTSPKQFTDIGYALLGYNVFRGYPLAEGHDPGFTRPIFIANYTARHQTADCRYKVPNGFFVIPDVSCVTSFSSKTLQTMSQFSKQLSFSAHVEGERLGAKFSASTGYKQASSEITTGESVMIISSAECNHYFSKLMQYEHPEFDDNFLTWLHKLDNQHSSKTYFEFFDTFGTHFPTEIIFGARFVYQHKMSSSKFETAKESGVNVDAEASYAGLFSVGGGMHLDTSQKKAASEFMKNVETKTITVGAAPPSDGNAMTWASQVASDPVPISYKLSGMENLFNDNNMKHLGVNYQQIRSNIQRFSKEYCPLLLARGELNFCKPPYPGKLLKQTRLTFHFHSEKAPNFLQCAAKCRNFKKCKAITFCILCLNDRKDTCYMYEEEALSSKAKHTAWKNKEWQSLILPDEDSSSVLHFKDTAIVGTERKINVSGGDETVTSCKEACVKDGHCGAFTYCPCPNRYRKCQFYDITNVNGLEEEKKMETIFI